MPRFCTAGLYRTKENLANEMNFVMNHAPVAGSLTRLVDQQSSATTVLRTTPIDSCYQELRCDVLFIDNISISKQIPSTTKFILYISILWINWYFQLISADCNTVHLLGTVCTGNASGIPADDYNWDEWRLWLNNPVISASEIVTDG